MVSRKVVISNPTGLHLRPAGLFCKAAAEFCCSVKFRTDKGISSAKSVLSVLGACVKWRLSAMAWMKSRHLRQW